MDGISVTCQVEVSKQVDQLKPDKYGRVRLAFTGYAVDTKRHKGRAPQWVWVIVHGTDAENLVPLAEGQIVAVEGSLIAYPRHGYGDEAQVTVRIDASRAELMQAGGTRPGAITRVAPSDDLMSLSQASNACGLAVSSIQQAARLGRLKSQKIGRNMRVTTREWLADYLSSRPMRFQGKGALW